MALRNSFTKGDPLCAGRYRVRGILDIGAADPRAFLREDSCANVELAVGTVGRSFGDDAAALETLELVPGQTVRRTGPLDLGRICAGVGLHRHLGW